MKTQLLLVILLLLSFLFSNCNKQSANNSSSVKTTKNDSLVFGDTKFSSDGLMGKVYLLPVNTSKIPDFDNMNVADTIYTHSLNIPNRTWSSGFPGLPDRSEVALVADAPQLVPGVPVCRPADAVPLLEHA